MPALPADIAKYTNDGVLLKAENVAVKGAHPEAADLLASEIEMFFKSRTVAQGVLSERFALRSRPATLHLGIEVDESLGLGLTLAVAPTVPCFRVLDSDNDIDVVGRIRAYTYDSETDRYSVEVME